MEWTLYKVKNSLWMSKNRPRENLVLHTFIRYKKNSCIIYSMVKLCLCNLAVYTSVLHFKRYLLTFIKQIWYYILMSIVSIPLSPNFWMMAMIIIIIIINTVRICRTHPSIFHQDNTYYNKAASPHNWNSRDKIGFEKWAGPSALTNFVL